jgi:tetratricopeptide (TPR) repeat protein
MKTAHVLLLSTLAAAVGTAGYVGQSTAPEKPLITGSVLAQPKGVDTATRLSLASEAKAQALPETAPKVAQASPPSSGEAKPEPAPQANAPGMPAASAQSPTPAAPPAAPQAPAPAQASSPSAPKSAVDESALRYFASQGDAARVQAEIARLRALYPNWVPPVDPMAVPKNGDTQLDAMWALYGEARYADVRKAISDRQLSEPGWKPPADLLSMLDLGEARQRLVNASNLKQYAVVIDTAAQKPELLVCSEIDMLWRLGEAFAKTDRLQRSLDAYSYILSACTDSRERLATLQKAAALLPRTMVETLLAQEKPTASGAGEFEPVKDDLARQFTADAGGDLKLTVPPAYLTRLERVAETDGRASDALLLGWYYVRRDAVEKAETWFRRARTTEDSAAASQGLALTLIARKNPGEAETVLYPWRETSDDTRATYLAAAANLLGLDPPVVIEARVLQRMAQAAMAAQSADVAQQFGWYARAFQQPQLAVQWFSTALTWKADSEPSAYGLAITANELKMTTEVARIQRQWAGQSPRIARLGEAPDATSPQAQMQDAAGSTARQAPVVREAPTVRRAETAAPRRAPAAQRTASSASPRNNCTASGNMSAAQALGNGWCMMELNRPIEAARSFDTAIRTGDDRIRSEAAYGQSLAYLRQGLTDKAAYAASRGRMDGKKATELQVAILSDRALTAFDQKRFTEALVLLDRRAQIAPERVDLLVLRGYAYLGLNRYADAIRLFETLAATGNRDAVRGLANARASTPAAISNRTN